MSAKLPAMMFYTGDWMKDPAVQGCSIAARGLWHEMLCLMHEAPRRGFLESATGVPFSTEQIARMTRCDVTLTQTLLDELREQNVYSQTRVGSIFSRRMERDESDRAKSRKRYHDWYKRHKINAAPNAVSTPNPTLFQHPTQRPFSYSISTSKVQVQKLPDFLSENPRPTRRKNASRTLDSTAPLPYAAGHADLDSNPAAADHDAGQCAVEADTDAAASHPEPPALLPEPTGPDPADSVETPGPLQRDPDEAPSTRQNEIESSIVTSLFGFYCGLVQRDSTRYTLTPIRKKKALLRLHERIKLTDSLPLAVEQLRLAIRNLASSEYHMTNGYTDWLEQIFRSPEEFEKRLTWKSAEEVPHAHRNVNGYERESVEAHNERIARETTERMDQRAAETDGEPTSDEDARRSRSVCVGLERISAIRH